MNAKTKIIIDTDPGIDDAIALFMAMADPDLEILGMTAVNGNVPVDKAEYNIRRICDFAWHTGIRVYKGCDRPLKRSVLNAEWVHGSDGLAGQDFGEPAYKGEQENAVDFIIKTLMKSPEREVSLVAIGPLTNIATVFLTEPKTVSRVRELIIMGGGFCEDGPRGNSTPYAEFNMLAIFAPRRGQTACSRREASCPCIPPSRRQCLRRTGQRPVLRRRLRRPRQLQSGQGVPPSLSKSSS